MRQPRGTKEIFCADCGKSMGFAHGKRQRCNKCRVLHQKEYHKQRHLKNYTPQKNRYVKISSDERKYKLSWKDKAKKWAQIIDDVQKGNFTLEDLERLTA